MRCRSITAILPAIALAAGLAAGSAPARAATGEEIRAGLQGWFTDTLGQSKAGLSGALLGEVAVTESGAGFLAVLPPIRLALGSPGGPAVVVDPVTVDLQPLLGGAYAANWTLPDAVILRDGDDEIATIAIGRHSVHGLYAPDLGLMLSTDLELHDVRAAARGQPPHIALDLLQVATRYDPVSAGVFDQSTDLRLSGLTALRPDGSEMLRVAAIALSGGARGVRLADWRALVRPAAGHRPKTGAGPQEEAIVPPHPDRPVLLSSAAGRHSIRDARFGLAQGDLAIGDGMLDLSVRGLDSGESSLAVAMRLTGLDLPAAMGPLTPREMTVDLVLAGLPTERLLDSLAALVSGAGPAGTGPALAMFGLHLQDAMMSSGARIEINEVLLAGDGARLRIAGTAKPTYTAALGVVARLDMSISGLATLLAAARAAPDDPETLAQLSALRAAGTAGTGPDGAPLLRYALEIDQQGQILLNGDNLLSPMATAAP